MSARTETIEQWLAAYNQHDAAGFAAFFAEDGFLRVVATGETNEGRTEIEVAAAARWRGLDYTLDTRGVYECGDDVWLEWTMSGTHIGEIAGIPATHRRFEGLLGCSHVTFGADGLIVSDLVYFDVATMLRRLGVMPEAEVAQPA